MFLTERNKVHKGKILRCTQRLVGGWISELPERLFLRRIR
jgi:hypothetical protein